MNLWFVGDIVRTKETYGLWEIVSEHEDKDCVWITNDECGTEEVALKKSLILVCRFEERQDIDEGSRTLTRIEEEVE